jgi:FkbM family methyltransferase
MRKPSRQEKLAHLDAALGYVKHFRMAVDAGAHVGNWTRVMAENFEKVIAFEPWPENYEKLLKSIVDTRNVTIYGAALGNKNALGRLCGEGHSKHYVVEDNVGAVQILTLDEFELHDLDFLKVDCEGADTLVLQGAEQTLKRCRPVVIVESMPKLEKRYGLPAGAPLAYLESLGAERMAEMWRDFIYVFPE